MSDKFTVEIITPVKSILKSEATQVTIPAYEGQLGILKDHIPLITFLRPGITKVEGSKQSQFFVAEVFTGTPGKLVNLDSTIKSFDAICKGEYDHLPEAAFYMVGSIEEAIAKAEKMAKEAAA